MKKAFVTFAALWMCQCFFTMAYAQIITTVAGGVLGHGGYWGDGGLATNAQIDIAGGLAVDLLGNIYIADGYNQRVRKVSAGTTIINTVAGTGVTGYNGNGILATSALLNIPGLVNLDDSGNFYIGDANNYQIRKVETATGIITDFAGNGILGYSPDGTIAAAANFDFGDYKFDTHGDLIYGSNYYTIRKITSTGIITTIAGTGINGNSGDGGPATAAAMVPHGGIFIDRFNNIYFADSFSVVRKISASTGIITTIAGTSGIGYPYCCDGDAATTVHIAPAAIAVDDTGNLYIADYGNSRIEKVDTFGYIRSIAGTGTHGYSGDGGQATAAEINHPENVVLDRCGNIYIDDFANSRVRKITVNPTCDLRSLDSISLSTAKINADKRILVYPNPLHDEVNITGANKITEITITNLVGQCVRSQKYSSASVRVDMRGLPAGVYVMRVTDEEGVQTVTRVIKE